MLGKTLNISMYLEMLPDFRFCFSYIEAYLSIIRKYIHTYSLEVLKLSSSPWLLLFSPYTPRYFVSTPELNL